ncbi:hypothetical protein BLNAU_8440 [Blattamonas nauphoetae]|uniref:TFIIS central domain-containing protein n=1 Tax=Blattamonas nauphoetae TaxID=2049346 RepID=A0ABQ9XYM3_9EUKA|nr:hypothetical protein BLNAU_8440 [Blattamonas nauphoetae]
MDRRRTYSKTPSKTTSKNGKLSQNDQLLGDDVPRFRLNARQTIYKKLRLHSEADESELREIARCIEHGIYESLPKPFQQNDYMAQSMEISAALNRDASYTQSLLNKSLDPVDFGKMTYEELASDDLKKQREIWYKDALKRSMIDEGWSSEATDYYTCPKCGAKHSLFRKMPAPSVDDVEITEIQCLDCLNIWRDP